MVSCGGCVWAGDIDNEVRLALSQENKEIVNVLVRRASASTSSATVKNSAT